MPSIYDFIKQQEGTKLERYQDQKGLPTIGTGFHLGAPENIKILKALGISPNVQTITPEQNEAILQKSVEEHQRRLNERLPENAVLTPEQHDALTSLSFQNRNLVGPNLKQQIQDQDVDAATKEIMLRSNLAKSPGITKRRIDEAKLYSGKAFPRIVQSLAPDEKELIRNQLGSIENENERKKALGEFDSYFNTNVVKGEER